MSKMPEAEVRSQLARLGLNPTAVEKYTGQIMRRAKRGKCPPGVVLECYRRSAQTPYQPATCTQRRGSKAYQERRRREYEALSPSDQVEYRINHNWTSRPLQEWANKPGNPA